MCPAAYCGNERYWGKVRLTLVRTSLYNGMERIMFAEVSREATKWFLSEVKKGIR